MSGQRVAGTPDSLGLMGRLGGHGEFNEPTCRGHEVPSTGLGQGLARLSSVGWTQAALSLPLKEPAAPQRPPVPGRLCGDPAFPVDYGVLPAGEGLGKGRACWSWKPASLSGLGGLH